MNQSIFYLSATELADLIRKRELSPVDVVSSHLDRINAVNPQLNAIVTLNDNALDEARAAESPLARNETVGPLHGVPFTVKDSFDVAGARTTRGSKLFANNIAKADATAVARLRQAGGVFLGKTNLPEFAMWWETDNLVFGRTVNPWNHDRIAGGSSGGEAAALAAGLTALGLGSDVAGSIRMPAHFCGVVGLKPTHGRIPLTGHWPDTLLRFMHVGPLARTVRDVGLALEVLAGPDGRDTYALPIPKVDRPNPEVPLPSLRVGLSEVGGSQPVQTEVREVVAAAGAKLEGLGCRVDPVKIPGLEENDWQMLSLVVIAAEGGAFLESFITGREEMLHPNLRQRLAATDFSLKEYTRALVECERLRRDVAQCLQRYDLLIYPCSALAAFSHGETQLNIGGQVVGARHALRATVPWNFTGSPVVALPVGWSSEGLPIGIQLVGRHFDEATLLHASMALEAISGFSGRSPSA